MCSQTSAPRGRTQPARILGASRACGGIGRRARLRALSAVRPVGVRVTPGALQKPRGAPARLPGRRRPKWLRGKEISNAREIGVTSVADGRRLADFSLVDQPTIW